MGIGTGHELHFALVRMTSQKFLNGFKNLSFLMATQPTLEEGLICYKRRS